jgi:hypothetical protein
MMEDLDLNNTYMIVTNTKDFFPKFKFTEDNIPIGDSIELCVSLHWSTIEKGRNFDLTTPVNNFPVCKSATGKFIWNEDDPKEGVDVPAWTQTEHEIDCTDLEDCQASCQSQFNALYLNGRRGKRCYSYKILKSICISVGYDSTKDQFEYKGGCFDGGKTYLMGEPEKNKVYFFDSVKFEVRNHKDPIIKAGEMSNYSYSFGASMVSIYEFNL